MSYDYDAPYRTPYVGPGAGGNKRPAPAFPRLVFTQDDRRLVQTDAATFIVERRSRGVDALGTVCEVWTTLLKLEESKPLDVVEAARKLAYGHAGDDIAYWLAKRIAETT